MFASLDGDMMSPRDRDVARIPDTDEPAAMHHILQTVSPL